MAIDEKNQTVRVTVYIPRKESPAHAIVHDMIVKWHEDSKTLQEHMFNALYDYARTYFAPGAPQKPPMSTNESVNEQARVITDVVLAKLDYNFELLLEELESKLSSIRVIAGSSYASIDERYDPKLKRILGDTTQTVIPVEGSADEDW